MYKVIAFFRKRDGLDRDAFIDYYENHHAPLILSLAPAPTLYRRNYVIPEDTDEYGGTDRDFDVITEIGFPDKASYDAWGAQLELDVVAEDERKLFAPSSITPIRGYALEERTTGA